MKLFLALFSSLVLICAAQAETPSRRLKKTSAAVSRFAKSQGERTYRLHFSTTNTLKGFKIYCPLTTCPSAQYDLWYQAVMTETVGHSILIHIGVDTLNGLSLETFLQKFGHAVIFLNFSAHFSDKAFKITADELIRNENINDWKFESFDGVNLKGKFSRKVNSLTIQRTDDWGMKHCEIQDSPPPRGCYKNVKTSMNIEVSFDLPVQITPYREIL